VCSSDLDEATADLVRVKAGFLFEQLVVEQIIGLLEGTTIYTTNAPANQVITIPETLSNKLKYNDQKDANPPAATIQVSGILSDAERSQAKALSNNTGWAKAIDRLGKQALHFFQDKLYGIFPKTDDAIQTLLAGDVNVPVDPENPAATDANTNIAKRFYFLQHFLPFLRQRLAHRLIVDTLSGAAGLSSEVTDVLLSEILVTGTPPESAISALEKIKESSAANNPATWKGYLIPSATDEYTFVATSDTQPTPLVIDGELVSFPHQQDDPSNVWTTDPIKLKTGTLYSLDTSGLAVKQLQWKTATSPTSAIPTSALLPDFSSKGTEEAFIKLYKAAVLVNGFSLNAAEVSYLQSHAIDFDGFDFNAVTLPHWLRLQAYASLRDQLPKSETGLLDLFKWASKPDDPATRSQRIATLSQRIAAATSWKAEDVEKLIAPEHFDIKDPKAFRNEVNLLKIQKALQVANNIGVGIDRLFEWANPASKFWLCHRIAEAVRAALRARYDQEDWEKVVKPLNDELRENQKLALISYLLVQQDLIDWGVVDADSLFEFFLIDVQMDPCLETSRIKQAISSVQLFVQRCLLGLEAQYGVATSVLDRDRWEWMQKYRVWEANRKVFLYPENWIKSELRDDKSPFYKELESELLQKDINTQTVEDALKSYLFKVDEVANLKVVGLFVEQAIDKDGNLAVDTSGNPIYVKLHVFARTRNAPYFFYYRYFQVREKNWYAWEKVQVDIPNYDRESSGQVTDNGTYLIPVVWNKRLLIFFPQFARKTQPVNPGPKITTTKSSSGDTEIPVTKPAEFWEIRMGWSEYRNGKWTQKQVSAEAQYSGSLDDISTYDFVPRVFSAPNSEVAIDVANGVGFAITRFHFTGSQISVGGALEVVSFPLPNATQFHNLPTAVGDQSLISSLQADGNDNPQIGRASCRERV